MEAKKEVHLNVNGTEYIISNAAPDLYLTDWLRDKIHLKGVKKQCGEGGCGSCVVAVSREDPVSHPESILAINSCMQPVICLDGCHVITVEGIGNKKNGFNIIQERFAENFASQCGFCTPGFVMNGFSYLANSCNSKSQKDIENCMDGNICRCTGYRPIIDAMKSFSGESAAVDIEDLRKMKICPKNCIQPKPKTIDMDTPAKSSWYDPRSLDDLFATLEKLRGESIKFISGSTGIFKNGKPAKAYIGLRNVKELNEIKASENEVEIGAGVTLAALIQFLQKNIGKSETFSAITEHLQKVASTPVRNAATWAGNLMLLNMDNSFPSDVFIIFSTIDAKLTVADFVGSKKTYSMQEFFTLDMSCKVILSATLPVCKEEGTLRTFTVMPRKQNTYGYVNAGFHAKFDKEQSTFKSKPRIIFGGVGLKMVRATELEDFLEGKHLNVFLDGVKLLRNCLSENPKKKLVDFKYCKDVAVNLFYKFWVSLCEHNATKRSLSAIRNFVPVESTSSQSFHVSEDENAAVNKPFIRVEGKMHASGEAQYVGDIPPMQNEVYAAFVLSTVASAELKNIDAAEAEAFKNRLTAEKHQELASLALRRKVTGDAQHTELQEILAWVCHLTDKQETVSDTVTGNSSFNVKTNMVEKDSGLEIRENSIDEMEKLRMQNDSMKRELDVLRGQLHEAHTKNEEYAKKIDGVNAKSKAFENHATYFAYKLHEAQEANGGLVIDVEMKAEQIEIMKDEHKEQMKKLADDHAARLKEERMKRTKVEGNVAKLQKEIDAMSEEIQKMALDKVAKQVSFDAVFDAVNESYEEEKKEDRLKILHLEQKLAEVEKWKADRKGREIKSEEEIMLLNEKITALEGEDRKVQRENEELKEKILKLDKERKVVQEKMLQAKRDRETSECSLRRQFNMLEKEYAYVKRFNGMLERQTTMFEDRLCARESQLKKLEAHVQILEERIEEKEILVQHLLARKRRGYFRRLFCC